MKALDGTMTMYTLSPRFYVADHIFFSNIHQGSVI